MSNTSTITSCDEISYKFIHLWIKSKLVPTSSYFTSDQYLVKNYFPQYRNGPREIVSKISCVTRKVHIEPSNYIINTAGLRRVRRVRLSTGQRCSPETIITTWQTQIAYHVAGSSYEALLTIRVSV